MRRWPSKSFEYCVLLFTNVIRYRAYCAAPSCSKFLHPYTHTMNQTTNVEFAVCEEEGCGKTTCIGCKTVIEGDAMNHKCEKNEEDEKFNQIAKEKGYQQCGVCGVTVELMEACNHIR